MARARLPAVLGLAVVACVGNGCLDALGHEEDVTQTGDVQGMSRLEDDKIEDKHPTFDPSRTVTERFGPGYGSCDITLNKSATVTKLDIVPFEGAEKALDGKLFRGRTEALQAIASITDADAIPSMEVVNGALKPFNDGLYAAVEMQVEDVKRVLLPGLAARLQTLLASADASARPAFEDAMVLVAAATTLGGYTLAPGIDATLASRASARATAFQGEPALARPIGFYTWTPELSRVFTRDRFLQQPTAAETFAGFAALAYVLGQDATLLAQYQQVTALYAGLTNPYIAYPIDTLIPYVQSQAALASPDAIASAFAADNPSRAPCGAAAQIAFLPASRSQESDYFSASYCDGLPPGTNLLDVLVQAIQTGALDLMPGTDSGWYDYQEYALETLLVPERGPESQHLLLTAGYKKKLIETFKSILIQTRETHVKQLAGSAGSSAQAEPVDVYPLFPAEPFPTFYLRTARAYRFLRTFLQAAVGASFLDGAGRVIEDGNRSRTTLADELDQRIALLYGLYFVSADAVGMARDEGLMAGEMAEIDAVAAVTAARTWLSSWKMDADIARDPRVIIPVFYGYDITTYWAVIGVKALEAGAEFVAGHEPVVTEAGCWTGKLVPHRYTLLVEESAEVQIPSTRPPPTRDELRAICDANATKDAIVHALEAQ